MLFGDAGTSTGLERLVRRAKIRLGDEADGQDALLFEYAVSAADYINGVRGFTPTDANPVEAKYESVAVDMVIFSFNKQGAEGQTAHNENGVSRSYEGADYPTSLTARISPVITVPKAPVEEEE